MKKKQLDTLEKINEERKLSKEVKLKIAKKALKNLLLVTGILLIFVVLKFMAINLDKQLASLVFKEISIGLFIITLFLFESAYKKDDDSLAVTSIEMFLLSIVTLLTPYILISRTSIYTSIIGVYFTVYYSIKNLIIYRKEKNEYLNKKSDIAEIIKKESQDKLAQEQLVKIKQEQEEKPVKRGRGRPRKTTTSETTKTTNKTTKTEKTQEEEPPKRKRGRSKNLKPKQRIKIKKRE